MNHLRSYRLNRNDLKCCLLCQFWRTFRSMLSKHIDVFEDFDKRWTEPCQTSCCPLMQTVVVVKLVCFRLSQKNSYFIWTSVDTNTIKNCVSPQKQQRPPPPRVNSVPRTISNYTGISFLLIVQVFKFSNCADFLFLLVATQWVQELPLHCPVSRSTVCNHIRIELAELYFIDTDKKFTQPNTSSPIRGSNEPRKA